jgi:hypothetical protein
VWPALTRIRLCLEHRRPRSKSENRCQNPPQRLTYPKNFERACKATTAQINKNKFISSQSSILIFYYGFLMKKIQKLPTQMKNHQQ